jgi:hypothetical protein
MADLFPVNGAKIYIGSASMPRPDADVSESDFSAVSWVEVKYWQSMGKIGDSAALITTPLIGEGRDLKQKGTRNAGQMQNKFAVSATDSGQLAMIAAEATAYNYPFRIVFNDAPDGGTPTSKYFVGLVMDVSEDGGNANTARLMNGTIEINSNVATVEAAA